MSLADLSDVMRELVVDSCLERDPDTAGILVYGSYLRAAADVDSDLDLAIFTARRPTEHYRTWFVDRPGGPLHVSAQVDLSVERWQEECDEPAGWSFGMPVEIRHAWLWVGDTMLPAAIGDHPVLLKPPGMPEIEDMVDAVFKMRRYAAAGDDLGVRLEAQVVARTAAPTVVALNDTPRVSGTREALEAVLDLTVAPPNWRTDLPICLGLHPVQSERVAAAAEAVASGVLQVARQNNPHVDPQPDVARYLLDGTFERILRHARTPTPESDYRARRGGPDDH